MKLFQHTRRAYMEGDAIVKHGVPRGLYALTFALIFSVVGSSAVLAAHGVDAKKSVLHITPGQTLAFDVVAPFSGPDAVYGAHAIPSAQAGAYEINHDGGVLGHKFTITQTDTRGDPADAVPVLNQAIATTSGLEAVLGPTSDEAMATLPILRRDGVPTFDQAGETIFDTLRSKWVFTILAPDDVAGVAMAYYARNIRHWTRAALMFSADAGSQSLVVPLEKTFEAHGGKIVDNEVLGLDQASYRTEILKMLAAKPQVIFTETDSQSAGTLWAQLKQLHGLTIPVVGSGPTTGPDYFQAVNTALHNKTDVTKFLIQVNQSSYHTKATPLFIQNLHAYKPGQDPLLDHVNYWDSLNVIALAMTKAKSADPNKWIRYVRWVTNDLSAKRVYNFAQGRRLIHQGKRIQYIGTKGSMFFNAGGAVSSDFDVTHFNQSGQLTRESTIRAITLSRYSGH
jgi:ABC-type branched-subunit amino acid transport system substrate-binding protein